MAVCAVQNRNITVFRPGLFHILLYQQCDIFCLLWFRVKGINPDTVLLDILCPDFFGKAYFVVRYQLSRSLRDILFAAVIDI